MHRNDELHNSPQKNRTSKESIVRNALLTIRHDKL